MKIAQLLPSLDVGGMERLVIALARQQQTEGHHPIIYCMNHGGAMCASTVAEGIPVVEFAKGPGFSWSFVRRLAAQLRADRPDVLHTHNALVHHYGVIAARFADIPVVVNTRHGYGNLQWSAKREGLFNAAARWTDAIVLVSTGVQRYFVEQRRIAAESTHVILNGTDCSAFLKQRARPGSHRPAFRFGTVGRLAPPKSHVTLIRAFARVAAETPGAELHILGEGECRPAIEAAIAEERLDGRVTLHGYSSDVAGFLSKLDVFVLSSISEGLPLAVLEAMGAGLPIVSTRLPGIVEVAPENEIAWYCEPGDAMALADSMIATARRSDLAAVGQAASEIARRYSISETWREYESLFRRLYWNKYGEFAVAS